LRRLARVVYEIENRNSGWRVTSPWTSVVLPAPDGAAITKSLALGLLTASLTRRFESARAFVQSEL